MSSTETLRLIEKLIGSTKDRRVIARARRLKAQLGMVPMAKILAEVPGRTIQDKCTRLGISRQTWYDWSRKNVRPQKQAASRLAKLTGYDIFDIRGY